MEHLKGDLLKQRVVKVKCFRGRAAVLRVCTNHGLEGTQIGWNLSLPNCKCWLLCFHGNSSWARYSEDYLINIKLPQGVTRHVTLPYPTGAQIILCCSEENKPSLDFPSFCYIFRGMKSLKMFFHLSFLELIKKYSYYQPGGNGSWRLHSFCLQWLRAWAVCK